MAYETDEIIKMVHAVRKEPQETHGDITAKIRSLEVIFRLAQAQRARLVAEAERRGIVETMPCLPTIPAQRENPAAEGVSL